MPHTYQPESKILCVTENDNVTECSSSASAFTQMLNCTAHACKPLSFYIRNNRRYFSSNVEMVFTMENHCLSPSTNGETIVNITGVSNFTMKGLGNISHNPSEEGTIQISRIVACSCSQITSGILFYKSNAIHIESLTIEDCGAEVVFINPHLRSKNTCMTYAIFCFNINYSLSQYACFTTLSQPVMY